MRIAVVDDNPAWHILISGCLVDANFNPSDIDFFFSDKQFKESDPEKYSIIFLDYKMTGTSGELIAERIRIRTKATIILMSSEIEIMPDNMQGNGFIDLVFGKDNESVQNDLVKFLKTAKNKEA